MTVLLNVFEEKIKKAGYSVTAARKAVFLALQKHEPQSMNEIVQTLKATVDRASVYRTIDLFEKIGVAQKVHIGWKYKIELTDAFLEHHHHMSCVHCGKLISIEGDSHIENDLQAIASHHGFTITSHQLEVQGLCSSCQNIANTKN